MKKKVILLDNLWVITGEVNSGKTTSLLQWTRGRKVAGFLTPDIDGQRRLMDLSTSAILPFEANDDDEDVQKVGRFSFFQSAFDYGNSLIIHSLQADHPYFIIDEFGKLEINGQGFAYGIDTLMGGIRTSQSPTIYIIVIRESLLDGFLERYGLSG
ncbi:MAG TPA: nucleoside-triphosphatase [Saprospiraceae bacterium]|nr:nucleoside-triphosphatase [Saprospiraceae bacterium]HPB53082.1 nucleoside-triphosphatase [Saprospiraceae bacterium]HQN55711.1 nucleoside-triphosphatase [Saprospiraceae bacterium]HRN34464.1 nucleoside-triphosphatase [Saprospiraceae bacterium]HRP83463.1 nucleoside-triphosphatase [Saprospiraceae bacterium]